MIFGNQNSGIDTWTAQGEMHGSKFAFSEIGNANSITVYIGSVTSIANIKCAIYDSSFNLVGETETKEIVAGDANSWVTLNIDGNVNLIVGDYWLAVLCDNGEFDLTSYGTTIDNIKQSSEIYPDLPDLWSPVNTYSYDLSIYCEVKYVRKYSEKAGTFTRKYSEKVGSFSRKYQDI